MLFLLRARHETRAEESSCTGAYPSFGLAALAAGPWAVPSEAGRFALSASAAAVVAGVAVAAAAGLPFAGAGLSLAGLSVAGLSVAGLFAAGASSAALAAASFTSWT